jgi:hypothetical protein
MSRVDTRRVRHGKLIGNHHGYDECAFVSSSVLKKQRSDRRKAKVVSREFIKLVWMWDQLDAADTMDVSITRIKSYAWWMN